MKIVLTGACRYTGLAKLSFPIVVEATPKGMALLAVEFETLRAFPEWEFHEDDVDFGGEYLFFHYEVAEYKGSDAEKERGQRILALVLAYGQQREDAATEGAIGTIQGMEICDAEAERILGEIRELI